MSRINRLPLLYFDEDIPTARDAAVYVRTNGRLVFRAAVSVHELAEALRNPHPTRLGGIGTLDPVLVWVCLDSSPGDEDMRSHRWHLPSVPSPEFLAWYEGVTCDEPE